MVFKSRILMIVLIAVFIISAMSLIDHSSGADTKNANSKVSQKDVVKASLNVNNKVYTTRLFNKYEGDSLNKYLVSTKNAPAKDKQIQRLAKKITKDKKTDLKKAEAIFNWVKNNFRYSRYGDTKYGGKKTIQLKRGNCVDTTHALVSLFRASKIPARYVNGKCKFTKGALAGVTVAHVWGQVLVGKRWMAFDGIYKGNRLGYVKNWKTNSYKLYGIYSNI